MPITAWNCPICERRDLELDHFDGPCGDRIHPDYPAAILHHEKGHYRYGKRSIGVTDVIGCPRRAAMQRDVDYAVDPTSLNSPSTGSAWDAWVTAGHEKVAVTGQFNGVHVIGEPDRLRGDVVEDWKHSMDFMMKYRKEAKKDHQAQVSMYADMLIQTRKGNPTRGRIWYHFTAEFGWPINVTLLSHDEILAYKPTDGPTTIAEHLTMLDGWRAKTIRWQDMPLTGEKQSYGAKMACDYCSLQGLCWKQNRGASF